MGAGGPGRFGITKGRLRDDLITAQEYLYGKLKSDDQGLLDLTNEGKVRSKGGKLKLDRF